MQVLPIFHGSWPIAILPCERAPTWCSEFLNSNVVKLAKRTLGVVSDICTSWGVYDNGAYHYWLGLLRRGEEPEWVPRPIRNVIIITWKGIKCRIIQKLMRKSGVHGRRVKDH